MKSKVMLSVLLLTCMALNVNLAWGAAGESHQWTTYSDWGGSDTKSWLRNNNANLPTFKYTPTYAVSKVVLNVRQSNSTGSNSIEVTIGGSSFGTKVSSLSGTDSYDITFEGATAMSGEIVITCTNTSGSGTGKGTFYLNSITLYENSITYTDYLTECESCVPVDPELSVTAETTTLTIGSNDKASTTLSTTGGNGGTVKYSVTPNTATITDNSITFTAAGTYIVTASQEKTADGKCSQSATVTITVNPRKYTLTFVDRGAPFGSPQSHITGEKATKPDDDPTGVCTEPINYVFDGWAEATIDAESTYTKVDFDTYTMPAKDTQLYAVYKYSEGEQSFAVGKEGNFKIYANVEGTKQYATGSVSDKAIATTTDVAQATTYKFTHISDGKYTIQASNGYYIGNSASDKTDLIQKTTAPTSTDAQYIWKISASTKNMGTWRVASTITSSARAMIYSSNNLKAYAASNVTSTGNTYYDLEIGGSNILYTSDPACGPHIGLSGDVRITSAKDVRVDAYTKITVSGTNLNKNTGGDGGTATAVSIKATSSNANFKVKRWGTSGDGTDCSTTPYILNTNIQTATYADSLCITYTPTEANITETATITLTAYKYGGTTAYATNTITVLGHSLPERFVIAAQSSATGWVALPNTLGSNSDATVPNAEDITINVDNTTNPTKLTTAPSNVIYTAAARADAYKNNSQTGLRFTVDGTQFLRASKSGTTVWLTTDNSQDMQSWTLRTEDFVNYQARLDSAEAGRYLAYNSGVGRIGHYIANNPIIRFLPFDKECTRLLAPTNLKVTQVKSSAITLTWDAVTGATGYAYSKDNGTNWTKIGNVLTYTITGLKAAQPYTIWVKGVVPEGDTDCSYYGTVSATTTNCDDVPYDISYTSDVNSITLSWTMTSATATVQVFSDEEGTTPVGRDYTKVTSPYKITGLTKATTYYVKISAGGTCPSELVEVSTERPQLDVVEWKPEGIDVAINTNEKISVVLENQVTKGTGTGKVAEDLFFSKYFEATGTLKLIGIYNGTNTDVDVSNLKIRIGAAGTYNMSAGCTEQKKKDDNPLNNNIVDVSTLGIPNNKIPMGTEIIIYYMGNATSSKVDETTTTSKCIENTLNNYFGDSQGVNRENWYSSEKCVWAGRQTLALYNGDNMIDVIGAYWKDGATIKADGTHIRCYGEVSDYLSDPTASYEGDDPGWFARGKNYLTDEDIIISTNRCLLIRSNSVVSGADAVEQNRKSDYSKGGNFTTLGTEWKGLPVGGSNSSDHASNKLVCDNFSAVAQFDYSGYYTTYDSLTTVEFEESSRNPDGTVTIPINRMDTLACKGLKIIAADEKGNVLTTRDYKVPILVTRNATTADQLFSHFGGDTCKKCDVVVRNNATLTKAADNTANDKPQVRDVMVYEGSSLVVPSGTNYTVNSLSLRRREDSVAVADVAGTLNINSTSDKPVYLDMRITAENWHWFTLPYDCAIADVTWSNEQAAKYRTDWFLMYYDGARRATGVDSGNWKEYDGDSIAAGQGFIIGIKGDGNDKHAFELRFPMAKEVITKDTTNKTLPVYAYGAGTDVRPNHKGWNLVGNPYLNYYKKGNINSFDGLRLGKLEYDNVTGWWDVAKNDNQPYIVIPQDFGWSAYQQVLVSAQDLLPFTSYFIQVGKDEGYENGQPCKVLFDKGQRGKSAKAALMTGAELEAEEEPVITGIVLRNAQGEEDETSLVIAEQFGSSYEMGADFFKWFGDYYKYYTLPVLYSIGDDGGKRAFNAVNEAGAKQSIPLGMYAARDGQYTFSLNTRSDLSRVDKVWLYDAESGLYTDLLREDYTFATTRTEGSGRFFLSVVLKEKEITTGASDVRYGDLRLSADKQTLVVRGLPEAAEVWVYDPSGKLLHHEQTHHYERHYAVPQQGTYLVRVESKDGAVTLRGVCR